MAVSYLNRGFLIVAAILGVVLISERAALMQSSAVTGEIRKVDFRNFSYDASCAGEDTVRVELVNGKFSRREGDFPVEFSVTGISYGDVDGDRQEDAAILGVCNTGGTGWFSEVFVFSMKNGIPAETARILGGDRADGGIRSVRIDGGMIVIEANELSEFSGACCPEVFITTRYRIEGNRAVAVGKRDRTELYPIRQVRFSKGTSRRKLGIFLDDRRDIARFVLSARRGQRLKVRVDDPSTSISLLKGDSTVIREGSRFEAVLNQSGDFVVQIVRTGRESVKTSVAFTIE